MTLSFINGEVGVVTNNLKSDTENHSNLNHGPSSLTLGSGPIRGKA